MLITAPCRLGRDIVVIPRTSSCTRIFWKPVNGGLDSSLQLADFECPRSGSQGPYTIGAHSRGGEEWLQLLPTPEEAAEQSEDLPLRSLIFVRWNVGISTSTFNPDRRCTLLEAAVSLIGGLRLGLRACNPFRHCGSRNVPFNGYQYILTVQPCILEHNGK